MNRPHLFHFFGPFTMESARKEYASPGRADAGDPGTGKALQTAAGKTRRECGVQGISTTRRPQYPGLLAPRPDTRKGD